MVLFYTNVRTQDSHSCEEIFYLSHTELENQGQLFIWETWKEADNLENYLLHSQWSLPDCSQSNQPLRHEHKSWKHILSQNSKDHYRGSLNL